MCFKLVSRVPRVVGYKFYGSKVSNIEGSDMKTKLIVLALGLY